MRGTHDLIGALQIARMGHSYHTPELAAEICKRLANRESLRRICEDLHMPPESSVRQWVIDDVEGFAAQYARARDVALDAMADEVLEISDTPQLGEKTKSSALGVEVTEGDMIEHRRLRVDSRKWYLSKLAPKRYGDRLALEHSGTDGKALIPPTDPEHASKLLADLVGRLGALARSGPSVVAPPSGAAADGVPE
jgi:hypothetical protein